MITPIASRISALRELMLSRQLDAWIVPGTDPHQGEYLAEFWQSRRWISGFTGSSGTVVITADSAGLWTDSRYYLAAEAELAGTGIELHRVGMANVLDYPHWLTNRMKPGNRVGIDNRLISVAAHHTLEVRLHRCGTELVGTDDLLAGIWTDRPALTAEPAYLLDDSLTGKSRADKISELRKTLAVQGATHCLVSTLDDIAWLLNVRGSDIPFNPLVFAYALVTPEDVRFCIDREKLSDHDQRSLENDGIVFEPYDRMAMILNELPNGAKLFLDPACTNMELFSAIPIECSRLEQRHVVTAWKAIKNETEQENLRNCMVRDGVALERFFFWFESAVRETGDPSEPLSEIQVAGKLREFRSAGVRYKGDCFQTISGFGPNGAIVHYSATKESNRRIEPDNLLLLDSGAHYLDGTTDITRVVAVGTPTDEQRTDFTLVLKAHIALAEARFPAGTSGHRLDGIARSVLWQTGRNYGHGTGHGVGFFLNVHEGPQKIAAEPNDVAMIPGMLTSNEPGLYRTGSYGIRIENLVLTRLPQRTEFGDFLSFETVSLCHIDRRLIDVSMLETRERVWVDSYHQRVHASLAPHLEPKIANWLGEKTAPL